MWNLIFALLCVLFPVFYWINLQRDYFKRHNVPYIVSHPILGSLYDMIKYGYYDTFKKMYNDPGVKDKPFFGLFVLLKPVITITDPELLKRILVKDFNSFSNRRTAADPHDTLGSNNLLTVKNPLWRTLRNKLTPFFSSGHLKNMFYILDTMGTNLIKFINRSMGENDRVELEVREMVALYSTDVIASAAYGIDANSLVNPNGEFRRIGKMIFNFQSTWRGLGRLCMGMMPEFVRIFNFKLFSEEGTKFIKSTVTMVMEEREKSGVKRNDLIDTLIELKKADIKDNEGEPITFDVLIAQAAQFFGGKNLKWQFYGDL